VFDVPSSRHDVSDARPSEGDEEREMAGLAQAERSTDEAARPPSGTWIVLAVVALGLSLFFVTVMGLIAVATRPGLDEAAVQRMIDAAVADRLGTPIPSGAAAPASPEPTVPAGFFTLAEVATHDDAATSC
jgi:hypothetical protein